MVNQVFLGILMSFVNFQSIETYFSLNLVSQNQITIHYEEVFT